MIEILKSRFFFEGLERKMQHKRERRVLKRVNRERERERESKERDRERGKEKQDCQKE